MPARRVRTPSYRLHKPSGQAVVSLNGRDKYLGRHGSPESKAEYHRLIAEWSVQDGRSPVVPAASDITVAELIVRYLKHADEYYRGPDGSPTGEAGNIRTSLRPLRELYPHAEAVSFGPLALKAVRQVMVEAGLCRSEINRRVGRIKRLFKWAVENEMVPPTIYQGLQAVAGLQRGRSGARETEPVRPVPDAWVEQALPHMPPPVEAMVRLQLLTGMRPGEVCTMRPADIDTTGTVWLYKPTAHKTAWRGKTRTVPIGPKAQDVLKPWLPTDLTATVFSPRRWVEQQRAERRAARRTRVSPSQARRTRKSKPRLRAPGSVFGCHSPNRDPTACQEAGVPLWHPNQLPHTAATRVRREFGLDAARALLGHSTRVVTEIYAELDMSKAVAVAAKIG